VEQRLAIPQEEEQKGSSSSNLSLDPAIRQKASAGRDTAQTAVHARPTATTGGVAQTTGGSEHRHVLANTTSPNGKAHQSGPEQAQQQERPATKDGSGRAAQVDSGGNGPGARRPLQQEMPDGGGAPMYGRSLPLNDTAAGATSQAATARRVEHEENLSPMERQPSLPVGRTVNETRGEPRANGAAKRPEQEYPGRAGSPSNHMDRANVVPIRRTDEQKKQEPEAGDDRQGLSAEIGVTPHTTTKSSLTDGAPMATQATEAAAMFHVNEAAPTDRELLEQISNLPLNSWSTFVVSPGHSARVRLSWVSPLSMKYLFVNNHGIRALMGTPSELLLLARAGRFFPGADVL
jgi:hypothetical protein